jgi:ketosteroid isomerase-like protein
MNKKNIKIKYKKVIEENPETSEPATSPADASVSIHSSKKFNPKWCKPVFVGAPAKDSSKKFDPKGGTPVIVSTPVLDTSTPKTTPSDVSVPSRELEGIEQSITGSAPIMETAVPETTPSEAPVPSYDVAQPISVKGSSNKTFVRVLITVVVLLCALAGYWYYQMQKSDNTAEYVASKETVVAVPAVTDKNSAQVSIPNEAVRDLVTKWLTSWKSGDLKTYRSFYASDFQSKGKNLDAWISHKTNVYKKSKNINITIDNLQISADENTAKASFVQYYSSSILNSKGKKTLELKKTGNEWKIYKEIM